MKIRGLMFDPYHNVFVVILKDEDDRDILPVWIGKAEAHAIGLALEGTTPPRPMSHDLIKSILDAVDAKVISVVVNDLKDNTYYAKLHLMFQDSEYSIDARPSDAIALALRAGVPVFASDELLRQHSSEELDKWLDNLRPEDFGKYDA